MDDSNLSDEQKELESVCKEYHPDISCRVTKNIPLYEETMRLELGDIELQTDKIYAYIHIPNEAKDVPMYQLANRLQTFDYVGRVFFEFFKE